MGRPPLKINTVEFVKMHADGVEKLELAKHFNISESSAHKLQIQLNLPKRRKCVKFDKDEYIRLFLGDIPYSMMSKKLGVSEHVVMKVRKRFALPARKRGRKRIRNVH
jgi:hypothetical protein